MESYKINAKDAVESLEIQGLFEQLGYMRAWDKNKVCFEPNHIFAKDGVITWLHNDPILFEKHAGKELTIHQLRDLVVLKRNDVKDANYRSKRILDGFYFKSCDGIFYFMFEGKWVKSEVNTDEGLEPITKGLGLISGADALRALADGKEVEYFSPEYSKEWESIRDLTRGFDIGHFLNDDHDDESYKFRLKPQTIKVELELPKPFEPKVGDEYWFLNNYDDRKYSNTFFKNDGQDLLFIKFGAWRTESEIKQVVEQLGKIKGAV